MSEQRKLQNGKNYLTTQNKMAKTLEQQITKQCKNYGMGDNST